MKNSYLTVTDQFCGAGGSSQGAHRLGLVVKLAMNHWRLAIETHNTNFPKTEHDCADISATDPRRYQSTNILLTSPECTNHTVAKGVRRRKKQLSLLDNGQIDPAAERSRATMWDVPRFAEFHDYEIIIVENVVDARKWVMWEAWIQAMHLLGYLHDVVYFNSMFAHLKPLQTADHGDYAPQSRDRMYVVFWKKGNHKPNLDFRPLGYCSTCEKNVESKQSWKKKPGQPFWKWGRYGAQYVYRCPQCSHEVRPYYYAALNAIDWTITAQRIGDRKKKLKPKTLKRIQQGLDKFAGRRLAIHPMPMLMDTLYTHANKPPKPITDPMITQTTYQSAALVMPQAFLSVQYTPGYNKNIDEPLAAVTSSDHHGLVTMPFLTSTNYFDDRNISPDDTMATQTTANKYGVTIPPFLLGYANGDSQSKGADEPLRTFHTENGQALVMPPFITYLRGTNNPKGMDEPIDTVAASGLHHGLVSPPFMMSYYGNGASHRPVNNEMGAITTKDKHALVQSGTTPKVEDCTFRMLQPHEIQRGMAFDDQYIVLGNKREQVKQLGNAVTPPVMKMILERCVATLS